MPKMFKGPLFTRRARRNTEPLTDRPVARGVVNEEDFAKSVRPTRKDLEKRREGKDELDKQKEDC